jgi:hypothetical protein
MPVVVLNRCVRFKRPEDVPIDLIADLCRRMTPSQWIALYESKLRPSAT